MLDRGRPPNSAEVDPPIDPRTAWPGYHRLACAVLCQACVDLEKGDRTCGRFLLSLSKWHQLSQIDPSEFKVSVARIIKGTISPGTLSIVNDQTLREYRLKWRMRQKEEELCES
jgi:hypothetical protein